MAENAEGCDLKKECGFYCNFIRSQSEFWIIMIGKYCNGSEFPLCARRIYFFQKGICAPTNMTPIGTLAEEILADL